MEDNNFEKYIRKKMDDFPPVPFEERHWEKMHQKMNESEDEQRKGGIIILPIWALAGLIALPLLFLFGGVGLYMNHHQKLSELEKTLHQYQNHRLTENQEQIKSSITIYDTIYQTVIINRNINQGIEAKPMRMKTTSLNRKFDFLEHSRFVHSKENAGIKSGDSTIGLLDKNIFIGQYSASLNNELSSDESLISMPRELDARQGILGENIPYQTTDEVRYSGGTWPIWKIDIAPEKKEWNEYLEPLVPRKWSVTPSLSIGADLVSGGFLYQGGALFEAGYNDHFGLVLGIEYLNHSFKREQETGSNLVLDDLPPAPQPEMVGDAIKEVYADFQYIQVPFGLNYHFLKNKKIQPQIALGMVSYFPIQSSLRYEYLAVGGGEYYLTQNNVATRKFQVDDIWTQVGIRYQFNSNWALNTSMKGQFNLRNKNYIYDNHKYLLFNLGSTYTF